MWRRLLSTPLRVGLTVLLGALFAFLCFVFGWFASFDLKIYDLGLGARSPARAQSDIVVIAIDRHSRDCCLPQPHFPISRHLKQHAEVIRRLKAAGAKVIAFDILFDQLGSDLDFSDFNSALSEAENIVMAGVIESQLQKITQTGALVREERMVAPVGGIAPSSYYLGLVNVPLGRDGVARQSYYDKHFKDSYFPSMPVAIVSAFTGKDRPGTGSQKLFYIDYSSPKGGFVTISYGDVLQRDSWQKKVKGRIALIGVLENGMSDTHLSPISDLSGTVQGGMLPGALILAYAANTLLENRTVSSLPRSLQLMVSLVLIIGGSFMVVIRRLALSMMLVLFVVLALLIIGLYLVAAGTTIVPTWKLIAIWLAAGAIGLVVNFSHTKLKSNEQETRLEEISSDLRMAQQIQQRLQPEKIPVMKEVEISGFQVPCKEIGGDYYDVIEVGENKVAVMVADVSGKGISGALVMSNFQSLVHSLAPKLRTPSQLFAELNQAVAKIVTMGRFVTFFYGILNRHTREFTYCNAGHTYPIWRKADGRVTELSEGGLFLGPFPEAHWEDKRIRLDSGDLIFVYTDGVTEAAIAGTEEQFGEKRLLTYIEKNIASSLEKAPQQLLREIQRFTRRETFEDDVTMLFLRML